MNVHESVRSGIRFQEIPSNAVKLTMVVEDIEGPEKKGRHSVLMLMKMLQAKETDTQELQAILDDL